MAFQSLRSFWAVIPATLANRTKSLQACLRLSGQLRPLTLTLRGMPDREIQDVLENVATRLTSIRLLCDSPTQFCAGVQLAKEVEADLQSFISSTESLDVHAIQVTKSRHWLRIPPPHLSMLRLTNFAFAKSCALPATLKSLTLEFTQQDSLDPMNIGDLTGVLSRLPMLEILCADLRYMQRVPIAQIGQAKLLALKGLTVRSCSPSAFNVFADRVTCLALNRAYLTVDLGSDDTTTTSAHFTAASAKLAELVLTGSQPSLHQPHHLDLDHIYLDERADSYDCGPGKGQVQATVIATPRESYMPFAEDRPANKRLASTAVFVFSVTRFITSRRDGELREPYILRSIVHGLPSMDFVTVTVHGRPSGGNIWEEGSGVPTWIMVPRQVGYQDECGYPAFKDFASTRKLNWFASSDQLAQILPSPHFFPRLNDLTYGRPNVKLHPRCMVAGPLMMDKCFRDHERAHAEIEGRYLRPRIEIREKMAQGPPTVPSRMERKVAAAKQIKLTWKAPAEHKLDWKYRELSPNAVTLHVTEQFDELLDVVGRRVI